jgi:hypothetical protein
MSYYEFFHGKILKYDSFKKDFPHYTARSAFGGFMYKRFSGAERYT